MPKSPSSAGLNSFSKLREKVIGELLGRAVDQTLSELGQLAPNLRVDILGQQRAAILIRQSHRGATLGKARHAAFALASDLVTVRRIQIA